ncbi:hypothetical protein L7F22_017043 [Adiantum nelumboides]|nr:hypothetical protein [Adiantum nelumboides]
MSSWKILRVTPNVIHNERFEKMPQRSRTLDNCDGGYFDVYLNLSISSSVPALSSSAASAKEQVDAIATRSSLAPATDQPPAPAPPQKPNRCLACRKRVGLTGFKCRCGDVFCSSHRYSDQHQCSFDYKAMARQAIAAHNPVVNADKVTKL